MAKHKKHALHLSKGTPTPCITQEKYINKSPVKMRASHKKLIGNQRLKATFFIGFTIRPKSALLSLARNIIRLT